MASADRAGCAAGPVRKETSVRTAAPQGTSLAPLHPATAARPAVVFLHGIGGAARGWAPQIAAFKARRLASGCARPAGLWRAAGRSTRWISRSLRRISRSTIDRLGLDRPVLVGHSMGGMIAQTMLRRRPDGYRAAVLVGTSPAFGNARRRFPEEVRRRPARPAAMPARPCRSSRPQSSTRSWGRTPIRTAVRSPIDTHGVGAGRHLSRGGAAAS